MGRISSKKTGKLNKQYRDPSVFYAPKRRHKSNRYTGKRTYNRRTGKTNNANYVYQNQANKLTPLHLAALLLALFIVIMVFCVDTPKSENPNDTQPASTIPSSQTEEIDLSAFDGECGITATAEITKESDWHLLDVYTYVTNVSGKKISNLTLYFVKCYDDNSAIESWQYADRLKIEDIGAGETRPSRWMLGTTDEGAREYKIFVGYILFDDGTEWGTEEISHEAVVSRGVEAEVSFTEIQK